MATLTRRIFIFGKNGQLAKELAHIEWPTNVEVQCCGRERLDLSKGYSVEDVIGEYRPDIIVNAAAYTAVDKAETEPDAAYALNKTAAGHIADAAEKIGRPILHISTDYVFDGQSSIPYKETDPVHPLSVYGASKEAGEQLVRATNPRHLILRTGWVFGVHGQNFLKTMLRLAVSNSQIKIVDDQYGGPTPTLDLALTIRKIVLELIAGREDAYGTFHYGGYPPTTWYDFATKIFSVAKKHGFQPPSLMHITTQEYGSSTPRPLRSVLDCSKIGLAYGVKQPDWQLSLNDCVASVLKLSAA